MATNEIVSVMLPNPHFPCGWLPGGLYGTRQDMQRSRP